jgi:hypothetical protein
VTDATLESISGKLDRVFDRLIAIEGQLAPMRAQLDGLPVIVRSLTVLQQEMRSLKAAFNDFARTNVTVGEIEALHADVNRVQAENTELATRLATVERLLEGRAR